MWGELRELHHPDEAPRRGRGHNHQQHCHEAGRFRGGIVQQLCGRGRRDVSPVHLNRLGVTYVTTLTFSDLNRARMTCSARLLGFLQGVAASHLLRRDGQEIFLQHLHRGQAGSHGCVEPGRLSGCKKVSGVSVSPEAGDI